MERFCKETTNFPANIKTGGTSELGIVYFSRRCEFTNKVMTRIAGPVLGLKQFLLQRKVIKLYRDLFRAVKEVPDEPSREELRQWIRSDFKKNKHETDEYAIKMLILHGEQALKELQVNVGLSR